MEYAEDGVNRLTDVARSPSGISTLYEATGGNPSSSPRWHANMALGGDQETSRRVAYPWRRGLGRHRLVPAARPPAVRRGREGLPGCYQPAHGRCRSPIPAHRRVGRSRRSGCARDDRAGPGWRPESMSPGVEEWLRELPDGNGAASRLPTAVLAVAGRAARSATSTADPTEVAVARVLTRSGRWVVLHGVPLAAVDSQRVAVIVEPAHPVGSPHC